MLFSPQTEREIAARFALAYESGQHVETSQECKDLFRERTMELYRAMPIKVHWQRCEPYESLEEMDADIRAGRFRMHDYDLDGYQSRVFGPCYKFFRAVHDFYGHHLGNQPFGVLGELGAYGVHCGQFPAQCWPMVFNELVLVNAYKEHFGRPPAEDKLVIVR